MTRVFLPRPFVCPVCHRKTRQLYPLTRYDHHKHRWVNGDACLACCGPEYPDDEKPLIDSQFRRRSIERW